MAQEQDEADDAKSRWLADPHTRQRASNLKKVIAVDIETLVAAASVSSDPDVRMLAAYYGRDVAFLELLEGGKK